jgi:multidrug efflux pump subunit AcrA (membrane-fusion protein)
VQAAVDALQALGMSDVQIAELATQRKASQQIELRSPVTGFVLERNVSPGQRFEAGDELYVIADLSQVWILADMFQYEASAIHAGQVATVELPEQGRQFRARVSEVLPQFDPSSRTLKVRLETHNPGFVLRPEMFVDVEFPLRVPSVLTVPADAILDSGLRKTVFVDAGDGYFEPRRVESGRRLGDRVEIRSGLMDGERVVTSGNFLLDSESRLKATAAGIRSEPAKDLICGMDVDRDRARAARRITHLDGVEHFFCSDRCKQSFDAAPERYVSKPKAAAGRPAGHHPDKTAQRPTAPPSARGSHDADRGRAGGAPHEN